CSLFCRYVFSGFILNVMNLFKRILRWVIIEPTPSGYGVCQSSRICLCEAREASNSSPMYHFSYSPQVIVLEAPSLYQDSECLDNSVMTFIPAAGVILEIGPLKSTFRLVVIDPVDNCFIHCLALPFKVKGKAISITWSLDTLGEWKRSMMSVILEMCSWGSSFMLLKNMFSFNSSIHCPQNSNFIFSSNEGLTIPGRIRALEQETRDLDVENKHKASYGVTTPQELRRNQINEEMSHHHSYGVTASSQLRRNLPR
ncbi:hypothetical protein Tco_0611776, partial [Tanacetum coccineum]